MWVSDAATQPGLDEVLAEVLHCVSELNRQLPAGERLEPAAGAVLLGDEGRLDSLALVNLLVAVEERVAGRFGLEVSLIDAVAEDDGAAPFATVGDLAAWLVRAA